MPPAFYLSEKKKNLHCIRGSGLGSDYSMAVTHIVGTAQCPPHTLQRLVKNIELDLNLFGDWVFFIKDEQMLNWAILGALFLHLDMG